MDDKEQPEPIVYPAGETHEETTKRVNEYYDELADNPERVSFKEIGSAELKPIIPEQVKPEFRTWPNEITTKS